MPPVQQQASHGLDMEHHAPYARPASQQSSSRPLRLRTTSLRSSEQRERAHSLDAPSTGAALAAAHHYGLPSPLRLHSAVSSSSEGAHSASTTASSSFNSLSSSYSGPPSTAGTAASIHFGLLDKQQYYPSTTSEDLLTDSPEDFASLPPAAAASLEPSLYLRGGASIAGSSLPPLSLRAGRPLPERQHSFVDSFSSSGLNRLPPPVLPEALAPLQLDSLRAQELDDEPPLTLPQPWAVERHRSAAAAARARRASFTGATAHVLGYSTPSIPYQPDRLTGGTPLSVYAAAATASATASAKTLREHEHGLALSRSRTRSRSPPPRRPSLAQIQQQQHQQSQLSSSSSSSSSSILTATLAPAAQSSSQHHHQQQQRVIPPDMPKSKFVEGLVGAACIAVEVVWKVPDTTNGGYIVAQRSPPPVNFAGSSSAASLDGSPVLPLRHFIKEVLRRSRSTCSTLQTALYYIHKSRDVIRDRVRASEEAKIELMRIKSTGQVEASTWNGYTLPSPPYGAHDIPDISLGGMSGGAAGTQYSPQFIASLIGKVRDPVLCGRRMFLAALICASKFLQDRTYSNRAWAKISSLPVSEINSNEKAFLEMMDYNLYVDSDLFRNWTRRLQDLSEKQERKSALAREGLDRSHSEYLPAPETLDQLKASSPLVNRLPHTPTGTPRSGLSTSSSVMLSSPSPRGGLHSAASAIAGRPPIWASASASAANLQRFSLPDRARFDSSAAAGGAASSLLPRPQLPPARLTLSGAPYPSVHGAHFRRFGGSTATSLHGYSGSCSDLARGVGDESWQSGGLLGDNMVL